MREVPGIFEALVPKTGVGREEGALENSSGKAKFRPKVYGIVIWVIIARIKKTLHV